MKSKNEILQQEAVKKYGETILKGQGSINYVAFNSDDGVLQNAMDEYAKEVAIDFARYVVRNDLFLLDRTIEDLFEKFKKENNIK